MNRRVLNVFLFTLIVFILSLFWAGNAKAALYGYYTKSIIGADFGGTGCNPYDQYNSFVFLLQYYGVYGNSGIDWVYPGECSASFWFAANNYADFSMNGCGTNIFRVSFANSPNLEAHYNCYDNGCSGGCSGGDAGVFTVVDKFCFCDTDVDASHPCGQPYQNNCGEWDCTGTANCGPPPPVCTSGQFDATNCRSCDASGQWTANCTSYGDANNAPQWCACQQRCTTSIYSTCIPAPAIKPVSCASDGKSAVISWTKAAGYDQIYLRTRIVNPDGSESLLYDDNAYTSSSYTFSNITPDQNYHWWVHTKDSTNGNFSSAVGGTFSCTLSGCTPNPNCLSNIDCNDPSNCGKSANDYCADLNNCSGTPTCTPSCTHTTTCPACASNIGGSVFWKEVAP